MELIILVALKARDQEKNIHEQGAGATAFVQSSEMNGASQETKPLAAMQRTSGAYWASISKPYFKKKQKQICL